MPKPVKYVVIPLLLLVALGAAIGLSRSSTGRSRPVSEVIESRVPGPNDKTLQNGQVRVDLLSGWDGRLEIDQIAIPDDQLIRVREQGILSFQPGEGRALEYFPAGQNCVTLTYWQIANADQTFTERWCFTAF